MSARGAKDGDGIEAAVRWLRTPEAVRARAALVLQAAEAGDTAHFRVDGSRLDHAAEVVVRRTRAQYPDLAIPLHSRWRHLELGGRDRWRECLGKFDRVDAEEIARIRFDLVVPSVLLDAGAGAAWRWREPRSGELFARSEGLALASLALFERGLLSSQRSRPLRADGAALRALEARALADVFQVGPDNPLLGVEGRALLLNRLGAAIELDPERFGAPARLGNLYDYLKGRRAMASCRRGPSSSRCSRACRPSGPGGSSSAATISAMSGATRRRVPTMRPVAWCRSTSCRSGSPIP